MIPVETTRYIKIDDVLTRFCELTGWGSTQGGIWNADFTKPVFDVKYPTNVDGHVLSGESKYIYILTSPEDYLAWQWKNLDDTIESLQQFLTLKTYKNFAEPYSEISFTTILLWLMRKGELQIEDAIYHYEW